MSSAFSTLITDGFGLLLSADERTSLWQKAVQIFEDNLTMLEHAPVYDETAQSEIARTIEDIEFSTKRDAGEVMSFVVEALRKYQLNTSHPSYFGVFNPAPSSMGILADALVASFNPQLASSVSSKFCIAIEDLLLSYFAQKFGYQKESIEGNFTTGATEANYTALLCALNHLIPSFNTDGLGGAKRPVVYCTSETHHSIARAVRICGLGSSSLRVIGVDADLKFDIKQLEFAIMQDLEQGHVPLFLVGTLGSTSAGVVDPLDDLALIAKSYRMWFHVDAAWGGAICLLSEFAEVMRGVECADSISFDPHKWLSVPMGCGMYLSRHKGILRKTFDVEESFYMPNQARAAASSEPYRQSMQWSRRFIGLKLFMTLAVHGEDGYQGILRHQIRCGQLLKATLRENDWLVKNNTPLPVACFVDKRTLAFDPEPIVRHVIATKRTFLTTTKLTYNHSRVLRAGVASYLTQEEHIHELVRHLNDARAATLFRSSS